jgi:hypothetical protein
MTRILGPMGTMALREIVTVPHSDCCRVKPRFLLGRGCLRQILNFQASAVLWTYRRVGPAPLTAGHRRALTHSWHRRAVPVRGEGVHLFSCRAGASGRNRGTFAAVQIWSFPVIAPVSWAADIEGAAICCVDASVGNTGTGLGQIKDRSSVAPY